MMAIRVLLDHDVPESNITLLSLLMARTGVHSVAYAFPKVWLIDWFIYWFIYWLINYRLASSQPPSTWLSITNSGLFRVLAILVIGESCFWQSSKTISSYYGTEDTNGTPIDSDDDAEVSDAFDRLECKSPSIWGEASAGDYCKTRAVSWTRTWHLQYCFLL